MKFHFVQDAFKTSEINILTPQKNEQNYIGEKIEKELEKGIVREETKKEFKKIITRMINEEKIDGVILGCTELPLLYNDLTLEVPTLDAMEIHIQQIVKAIESK